MPRITNLEAEKLCMQSGAKDQTGSYKSKIVFIVFF